MELIELSAKARENKGKGANRKLRAQGAIPAIVYGAKTEPAMISLDTTDFDKIIRENGTTGLFFDLSIEGGQKKAVMLKELQMDPFGLRYQHVDLHEIDMDTQVSVVVPVEPAGASAGVKEGGLVQIIRRELEVLCKPKDTPESIVLDITELNIGDSIHVEDIDMGEAIEIPHDVNFTVLTIVPPEGSASEGEDEDVVEEEEAAPATE